MPLQSITQCNRCLDFAPRAPWPRVLPAYSWRELLMTGFERKTGYALDLFKTSGSSWLEALIACYPSLALAELGRLFFKLEGEQPELLSEYRSELFAQYGLRWCDRLHETLIVLNRTPQAFQDWVDDKKAGARDLSVLLAVPEIELLAPLLNSLAHRTFSKSQAIQALEWAIELFLMGRKIEELLPKNQSADAYLQVLSKLRKPNSAQADVTWSKTVSEWPWPAQVQGQWQRFGDQAGLEVKLRAFSPQDFNKKLERLASISESWACKI